MVVPLYIGEISPPEIRGSLLVFEALFVVLGIVVAFSITYATRHMPSDWPWQLPFLLQIIPGVILGLGAIFLPFSPRWLASKGREEEALHNLAKLRRLPDTDNQVRMEWLTILAEARFQHGAVQERHPSLANSPSATAKAKLEILGWIDCFKGGCWRRTMVGAGLMFFQQFLGINALIYYSPTLFGTMGLESGDAAHHVRRAQRPPAHRRLHQYLDNRPLRPQDHPALGHGRRLHPPPHHRNHGGQVLVRLAVSHGRGVGVRGPPLLLHACIWSLVGARAVGYAC